MVNKSTEEEKLTQSPIVVILGGKKYDVAPLVIRDSRGWRRKVIALIAPLPGLSKVTTRDMDEFEAALKILVITMPDQVIDLFFEYAKDLKQEEIEAVATDAEMAEAFKEVIAVAFPLAQSAPDVIKRLSPEEQETTKNTSQ